MVDYENGGDYAAYITRQYHLEREGSVTTAATTSIATRSKQPQQAAPVTRKPMTAAERLSRNRQAKRASIDVTTYNHLSTMYHMNRRIYEMYNKAGLPLEKGRRRPGTSLGVSEGLGIHSAGRPTSPDGSCCQDVRPSTAPVDGGRQQRGSPLGLQPKHSTGTWAAQSPPSYTKRQVQNTAAALKAAILDEIVAHRVYDSQRLKALFRSYLKLNASEAFLPTLTTVVEELKVQLGVA